MRHYSNIRYHIYSSSSSSLLTTTGLQHLLVSCSCILCSLDSSSLLCSSLLSRVLFENRLSLEFVRENRLVSCSCKTSMSTAPSAVCSTWNEATLLLECIIFFPGKVCESPFLCNANLLTSRNLVTCTTASFDRELLVILASSDGHEDLSNAYTSDKTNWLTESVTHTGLEPIGSCTRKHLIDTKNVERVSSDTHVECIFSNLG
mmetsp:Transcript_1129/g.1571  ORF Transcript_1129/g.1571 Transcript_1129/m.1571 type:complete len:204 (-) Transcript_1129:243-854(-)